MELLIPKDNPSIVRILNFSDPLGSIKESLTYKDTAAAFEYYKYKKSIGYHSMEEGSEAAIAHLAELKEAVTQCILMKDEVGYYTYSGLDSYVQSKLHCLLTNEVEYPEFGSIPWYSPPTYDLRYYQREAHDALINARHAGVSLPTGSGKTAIISQLLSTIGLRTVIMTPSTSISGQIFKELTDRFGKKYVGAYFGTKKHVGKLFTVCNAQSLTNIEPGTEAWEWLSGAHVFIADESHQCPATTLAKVCFGLCAKAPYRYFLSATQMRNDGSGLLLDAITGPIVYTKEAKTLIDEGYLAKPIFKIVHCKSKSRYRSKDALKMIRNHLYYNPEVLQRVGHLVNMALDAGMPTLVLIEEVEQFTRLLGYLRHKPYFAHGALNADQKTYVPPEYWKSDPNKLVKAFNDGGIDLLVGTSCIGTGTDIKPVKFFVYFRGGKSEIEVRQGIGRTTRLVSGKTFCHIVDIDVNIEPREDEDPEAIQILHRHAEVRREIYEDTYPGVKDLYL